MADLPTGTVTFLFTDIEGSTRLWEHHPEAMAGALARHDAILRQAVAAEAGVVYKVIGDAVQAAFPTAPAACAAALAAQRALTGEAWGVVGAVPVRMALHTCAAVPEDGDYRTGALNRLGRLLGAVHGGQIVLSRSTAELARETLPPDVSLRDLGERHLRDLRPEPVFELSGPDLPSDFPPLRTLDRPRHNLPAQPTALIGREKAIGTVCALLRRADVRLVTLTGPGGIGKTRLGLQVAAELLDDVADGVTFVALDPISDPDLVATTIAQALGLRETGTRPLQDTIKDYLREKQILLLLDNFEQVVDAAPQVADLMAACPQLKLLVTSREVLHLYGERDVLVPPLALPPMITTTAIMEATEKGTSTISSAVTSAAELTQYEAVRLFIERAQAVKPDFAVTDQNAPAVVEICVRLDGLPLAIELAAARVGLFPPEALLARLSSPLKVLTGGLRDRPARQQTLRNTIDWSYYLLSSGEQMLFARLGVFVGGCTLDAADAVCNADGDLPFEVAHGITSLLDKSLLRQIGIGGGEPRVTMLEAIRAYALERLERSEEADAIRQRHAAYFCTALHVRETDLRGRRQIEALDAIGPEVDNLRAAWYWAVEHDDLASAQRALDSLYSFYEIRVWPWRASQRSAGRSNA